MPARLGFSVAGGEGIELTFTGGALILRFLDWRQKSVEHRFAETLALRWSSGSSTATPRDDEVYELLDSSWLQGEVQDEGLDAVGEFVRYILCFNASKVLDVICKRDPT